MSGAARRDEAHKVAAARNQWVPAVSAARRYGRWRFVEVTDIRDGLEVDERRLAEICDPIRSSVLWSLTIIGEAVSRLPGDSRARHPDIECGRITGFRNLVVHAYEQLARSILEVTARERVSELRRHVEAILRAEYPLAARAVAEHRRGWTMAAGKKATGRRR